LTKTNKERLVGLFVWTIMGGIIGYGMNVSYEIGYIHAQQRYEAQLVEYQKLAKKLANDNSKLNTRPGDTLPGLVSCAGNLSLVMELADEKSRMFKQCTKLLKKCEEPKNDD
jgi:hypothetical protein